MNEVRRENPALQHVDNVSFLETESEFLIAYAKRTGDNVVITVVNLDPFEAHDGVAVVPAALGLPPAFPVRDLLTGEAYGWHIGRNFVERPPGGAHVLRVGR